MQVESANNSVVITPMGSLYKLRFDDDIIRPSYYRFELEALSMAQSTDKVEVTINTDGGSLATGIEVANAIFCCQAEVEGILRSNCHSCGSIIFLACRTHDVGLASEMLLHSGSGGSGGTPSQSIERAKSYKRQVRALFETVYKGFLSLEELDKMIDEDKEFIFSGEEIVTRLEEMYVYRDSLATEHHQEIEDSLWEQNVAMIKESVAKLDISQEDKDTFHSVSKLLDETMMEEYTENTQSTPDTKPEEVVDSQLNWLAVPCHKYEDTEVGLISYSIDSDGVVSEVELSIATNADYLILNELEDSDRDRILSFMKEAAGKNLYRYTTTKLIGIFTKYIHGLIEADSSSKQL